LKLKKIRAVLTTYVVVAGTETKEELQDITFRALEDELHAQVEDITMIPVNAAALLRGKDKLSASWTFDSIPIVSDAVDAMRDDEFLPMSIHEFALCIAGTGGMVN
jgi:hypothetical protein